jgi:hypothetical protein
VEKAVHCRFASLGAKEENHLAQSTTYGYAGWGKSQVNDDAWLEGGSAFGNKWS